MTTHEGRGVRETVANSAVEPTAAVWVMKRGRGRGGVARWTARLTMLAIVSVTLLIGGASIVAMQLTRSGPSPASVAVIVPPGMSVAGIGELLTDEGVVRKSAPFAVGVRLLAGDRPLQAGEFIFPQNISALDAIRILQKSAPVAHPLTIPEGLTVAEILAHLAAQEELSGTPSTVPDEGSLLPETYHYTRGDNPDRIIERMRQAMEETIGELWPARAEGLPLATPAEAIVLASIVERETGKAEERPLVAAVFINRLNKGMRLQADPTVAYAISGGQGLDRSLRLKDLEFDSPYNTYIYAGLPPGPIANPGRASIEAVLRPAASKALYFVANGNGGHAFADTLEEHNDNVAAYRASQR